MNRWLVVQCSVCGRYRIAEMGTKRAMCFQCHTGRKIRHSVSATGEHSKLTKSFIVRDSFEKQDEARQFKHRYESLIGKELI